MRNSLFQNIKPSRGLALEFYRELHSSPLKDAFDEFRQFGIVPLDISNSALTDAVTFAILQGRSNRRWWLIPLSSPRSIKSSLSMLHPSSFGMKCAKYALQSSPLSGLLLRMFPTIELPSVPARALPFCKRVTGYALFTGTDGPHRKSTIQFTDENSNVVGYAKIAGNPEARQLVTRELETLTLLSSMQLSNLLVPRVLQFENSETHTVLVTEADNPPPDVSTLTFHDVHLRALRELHQRSHCDDLEHLKSQIIDRLSSLFETAHPENYNSLYLLEDMILPLYPTQLSLSRTHGDFTPWNCVIRNELLYVYDWEYSTPGLPYGYDYIHFMLSCNRNQSAMSTARSILDGLVNLTFCSTTRSAVTTFAIYLVFHFYRTRLLHRDNFGTFAKSSFYLSLVVALCNWHKN